MVESSENATSPVITLSVNPTNPGHYFACCGLLDLITRLDRDSLGWFAHDGLSFNLASAVTTISQLVDDISAAKIISLVPEDAFASPLLIGEPFLIRLDWWKTTTPATSSIKTWSGQMKCQSICIAMLNAIRQSMCEPSFVPKTLLFDSRVAYISEGTGSKKVEPFYFDANRGPNAHSRDVGFAPNDLGLETIAAPASELLCLVGLQRSMPSATNKPRTFDYHLWHKPLPASLLASAVNGLIPDSKQRFRFESWFRDGQRKNKAFLPARAVQSLDI